MQVSLFGDAEATEMPALKFHPAQPWSQLEKLKNEKEVVGFYLSGHPLDTFRFEINTFCNTSNSELADLSRLRNKEVAFAGIVTSAHHRVTKMGKPFGIMTIEDYTAPVELAIFGEDYLKFKGFMETGYYLFIKARIQSRFNDQNTLEIKVGNMKMLADVGNELAKSITLQLDLHQINEEIVNSLKKLLSEYPGKLPVRFSVKDAEQRVELASKKVKVNFCKELFDALEFEQDVGFRING